MSETDGQEEPSMEEILASIRRIISEDDEDKGEAKPAEAAAEPEPEPEAEQAPEPEPEQEEEILELTEMVEDEVEDEDIELEIDDEPEPEPVEEPEPEPEPELVLGDMDIDDVDPAEEAEVLMSETPSIEAMGQFQQLSALLTTGYQGSGNTLEDLVRELLKPMLKSWLDDNLPPIVERMVAKEIARLARTKKP